MARQNRPEPNEAHWQAVKGVEYAFGLGFIVAGVVINQFLTANGMGWFLVGAGVWTVTPSGRGVLSGVVDRLPLLPKRVEK